MSSPLRVVHCPHNIAGNPAALAAAERSIGLDSRSISLGPSPLGHPADEVLWDPTESSARKAVKRGRLLRRALGADIVHYNFGATIAPPLKARRDDLTGARRHLANARGSVNKALWMKDLPLLHHAGKVIAVTFQGDDARQGDFAATHFAVNASAHTDQAYYTAETDELKRTMIAQFDRYAQLIYSLNPDLLHVLPPRTRFLPYASVDPRHWQPTHPDNPRPVIVHAPTHRGVKGTEFLLEAVDRLRAEGEQFEFVLVEDMQRDDARRVYERADLLVDQLLLGWYGALAVEVMALGKPVVAYVRSEDLVGIPAEMRDDLPVVSATPDTVYGMLRTFLAMSPDERATLGVRSRQYVERWHDPVRIAESLAADYRRAARR